MAYTAPALTTPVVLTGGYTAPALTTPVVLGDATGISGTATTSQSQTVAATGESGAAEQPPALYTAPALTTPVVLTGGYTPPALTTPVVLGDATGISGTATTSQSNQTDSSTGELLLTGTAATAQGQTADAVGTLPVSGNAITSQGHQTTDATGGLPVTGTATTSQSQTVAATGESGAAEQPNVAGGRAQRHRLPGIFGQASSGQGHQTTSGSGTLTLVGHIASGQGHQTTSGSGTLTLVGSLHTQQTQTPAAHGVIDRYARARREDELWLLAA